MAQQEFVNRYTMLDRLLHSVAFGSHGIQTALADIEDRLVAKQLVDIEIDRPVFVTALPRAGTTILLNLLHTTGEFACHTYRSMPFILCPVFWHNLSKSNRSRSRDEMERAHGDGILISVDSPEAFEEVIWNHFWPNHYSNSQIQPWALTDHSEFHDFFRNHIRKLILVSGDNRKRYVSKNNTNIARLSYVRALFPDAIFVVLFRSPLQQALSLLRQHLNFMETHDEDLFAKKYMQDIGHFDFGGNLSPINFDNWLDNDRRADPTDITFWLEYWIAAYRHVLDNADESVFLVSFESMTKDPKMNLKSLSDRLGLRDPTTLVQQHQTLRQPKVHHIRNTCAPGPLLEQADELFAQLVERSED